MDRAEAHLILGIEIDATADEAEIAYRRLAKVVHPDAGGDAVTFELLHEAWTVIAEGAMDGDSPRGNSSARTPAGSALKAPRPSGEEMTRYLADLRFKISLVIAGLVLVAAVAAAVFGADGGAG